MRPRLLIISRWPRIVAIARLPKALAQAGFSVAAVCRSESFLAQTRYLDARFPCPSSGRRLLPACISAIRTWKPDIILPGSDYDLEFLHRLALAPQRRVLSLVYPSLSSLLQTSLGDPAHYQTLKNKRALQELARQRGFVTPGDCSITNLQEASLNADQIGYPVVLKSEFGRGGTGVSICSSLDDLIVSFNRMRPVREGQPAGRYIRKVARGLLLAPDRRSSGRISIQKYITGKTVLHNFVALKGEYLAGMTAEMIVRNPEPTGPSSVVRCIENSYVEQVASAIVSHTGFSGFGCFDFIVEESTNKTYLLECNAKPTNVAHLGRMLGQDLCAKFYERVAHPGSVRPAVNHSACVGQVIARFPNELCRDPESHYVNRYYHDVPTDDPELLKALLDHFKVSLPGH